MGAPTIPPTAEQMLADQRSRWAQRNRGRTLAAVAAGTPEETPWETVQQGNMFFTGEDTQPQIQSISSLTRNPFIWEGDNRSLRDAYESVYDQYYKGSPGSTTFNATWEGPQIRALYDQEGLDLSPDYWQDNDMSGYYSSNIDDMFQGQAYQPEEYVAPATQPAQTQTASSGGLSSLFGQKEVPEYPEYSLEKDTGMVDSGGGGGDMWEKQNDFMTY